MEAAVPGCVIYLRDANALKLATGGGAGAGGPPHVPPQVIGRVAWKNLKDELSGKEYKIVNPHFKQRLYSAGLVEGE